MVTENLSAALGRENTASIFKGSEKNKKFKKEKKCQQMSLSSLPWPGVPQETRGMHTSTQPHGQVKPSLTRALSMQEPFLRQNWLRPGMKED